MYVNEPSEKAHLPEVKGIEDFFEEPRNYHDFFYDDQPVDSAPRAGYHRGIQTQVCRFAPDGSHSAMARDCPHFSQDDETGRTIQKGWTVQK